MAQGKMAGSPFHVDTSRYIYAIEHENEGYLKHEVIDCGFRRRSSNQCNLWNSGEQACQPHRCTFRNRQIKENDCRKCAYYNKNSCIHPKKPETNSQNSTNTEVASYCCFYLTIDSNEKKYRSILNQIERHDLSERLNKNVLLIQQKRKDNEKWNKELKQSSQTETENYLQNKISKNTETIESAIRENFKIVEKLYSLGGPVSGKDKTQKQTKVKKPK